ncbi:MAG: hypothetical protein V1872_02025 [bacterium]
MKKIVLDLCSIIVLPLMLTALGFRVNLVHAQGKGINGIASDSQLREGQNQDEQQQSGYSDDQGWFCPYCGAHMNRNYGDDYGMGQGRMMGKGCGSGLGYGKVPGIMCRGGYRGGNGYNYLKRSEPLTQNEATALAENYIKSTRNPNLKLGNVGDKSDYYEAEITTQEGSLVDKLQINKDTGLVRFAR